VKRRELLLGGLGGLALGVVPAAPRDRSIARDHDPQRILVVVELAGGNDGLDTLLPVSDDAWHRARPTLRAFARGAHHLDADRAFHPALAGFDRLWREGRMAIVEGCGHAGVTRSHFDAMGMWHRAAATGAEPLGWIGRLADDAWSEAGPASLVSVGATVSPALRSRRHGAVVFSDPERSVRWLEPRTAIDGPRAASPAAAETITSRVRAATFRYRTPVEYGAGSLARDRSTFRTSRSRTTLASSRQTSRRSYPISTARPARANEAGASSSATA